MHFKILFSVNKHTQKWEREKEKKIKPAHISKGLDNEFNNNTQIILRKVNKIDENIQKVLLGFRRGELNICLHQNYRRGFSLATYSNSFKSQPSVVETTNWNALVSVNICMRLCTRLCRYSLFCFYSSFVCIHSDAGFFRINIRSRH